MAGSDHDLNVMFLRAVTAETPEERDLLARFFWYCWEYRIWWGKTRPLPNIEEWLSA